MKVAGPAALLLAWLTAGTAAAQQLFAPAFSSTPVTAATEGEPYQYTVTVLDFDLLDTIAISIDQAPGWLALTDHGDRTATLAGTPPDGGNYDVRLEASDGAQTAEQSFTITVAQVNAAPVAANDAYTTAEDTQLSVNRNDGVLANDSDDGDDDLDAILASGVAHGTLALNANGSFVYMPEAQFSGTDTFTYRASDGSAQSDVATVTITVSAANDPPVAADDSYTTAESAPLSVGAGDGVLANDTDDDPGALTAVLTDDVDHGALTLNANGSFAYTPEQNFNGSDSFRYRASDGTAESNNATVTITITAVNGAPVAVADNYNATEDTPLTVSAANGVLANDTDSDGDPLTAVIAGAVSSGTLTLNADGSFTFTPAPSFSGTATFTYGASDGIATSAPATVTLTVSAVNDPPAFTSTPTTTATEDVAYSYTMQAADADNDNLTYAAPVRPAWLAFTPPATLAGTPAQEHVGVHNVSVTVTDGESAPVTQTFQINVAAADDAPLVAAIPAQTATENAAFSLDLAQYVSDADTAATSLVYAAVGALPAGFTIDLRGTLSAAAVPGAVVGDHTVQFSVSDATSTVTSQLALNVLRAGRADLALAITVAPTPVAIGVLATWTFTITNNSPGVEVGGVALDARFTGNVPFRFDPPATPGCALTPAGNDTLLACTLGALGGGAATAIAFTGSGSVAGDLVASGSVSIPGGVPIDETPANDTATGSLSVAQSVSAGAAQEIADLDSQAAAAADLNADGFDDLTVVTSTSTLALLNTVDPADPNKRALTTAPTGLLNQGANGVAAGDLDADADIDLVIATPAGAANRVLVNAGDATFTQVQLADSQADSRDVAIADVDGDGRADIAFANAGPDDVFRSVGASYVRAVLPRNDDSRGIVLVNLFGDGLPELVTANADGDAAVYRNTGGIFALELTLATGPATSVAAGDFNGDGAADLVFGRRSAAAGLPTDLVWLNTSGATGSFFLSGELGGTDTTYVTIADFDLDGDVDILAAGAGSQRIYTNVGAASGTFVLHSQQLGYSGARKASAGRFSVDERVDLALAGSAGVAVFFNDGAGNFGRGDTGAPTIQLTGDPQVTVIVEQPYTDAGATATDTTDGDLTARLTVDNPVNTAVIGDYTVTYGVTDLSGNAALPATRTVHVQAREGSGGGGGGAADLGLVLLLTISLVVARRHQAGWKSAAESVS